MCHPRPGLVQQVRSGKGSHKTQVGHVQHPVHDIDIGIGDLQFSGQQFQHFTAHRPGHLQSDRPTESATGQLRLDGGQQIAPRVLLQFEVGVAGHSEKVIVQDSYSGEQLVQMGGDHLIERNKPPGPGQGNEGGKNRRDLHPGESHRFALHLLHLDRQVERETGDVRERMGRIHRQGSQHGKHRVPEIRAEVGGGFFVQIGIGLQAYAGLSQGRFQNVPVDLGSPQILLGGLGADGRKLLAGGASVGSPSHHPVRHLLFESRHPHLEEFVQVGSPDGKKPHFLQQRNVWALGQKKDPAVEIQPGKLPVENADRNFLVGRHQILTENRSQKE